ncbi:MAG TPA: cytochrome c [Alphaproteobacteria bacterium]
MMRGHWLCPVVLAALIAAPAAWAQQAAAPPLNDQQKLGQRLFTQSCMVCHTKPQITSGMYGPPLSKESAGGDVEVMRTVIADGTPRMPGFKYHFTSAQIDALAQYLKTVPKPVAMSGGSTKGDVD